jgi:hypothetical protein
MQAGIATRRYARTPSIRQQNVVTKELSSGGTFVRPGVDCSFKKLLVTVGI